MAISKELKAELIKKYGKVATNTGKVEVQLAILTEEIKALTQHLIANKKDFISKRGLHAKVSRRKALLTYLKNKDINRYRDIVKALNIRSN